MEGGGDNVTESSNMNAHTYVPPTPGGTTTPERKLRRPLPDTEERLRHGAGGDTKSQGSPQRNLQDLPAIQKLSLAESSPLSVNAVEFTPRSRALYPIPQSAGVQIQGTQPTPQSTVPELSATQNNLNFTESAAIKVDGASKLTQLMSEVPVHLIAPSVGPDSAVVDHVKYTLFTLTVNPGSFHELMNPLTEHLNSVLCNEATVQEIVHLIFEQAVLESNFHYTGARVCEHFSHHLKLPEQSTAFRNVLLNRCKQEHEKREQLVLHPSGRLRGFVMFMAELFLNITLRNGERMKPIAKCVRENLHCLLAHPSDDNFKCVAQVLKLCGAALDDMERVGETPFPSMDAIFYEITNHTVSSTTVSNRIVTMLVSVVELRSGNWGRSASVPSTPTEPTVPPSYEEFQAEPVFYNEQGQEISRDEAGFYLEDDFEDFISANADDYQAWAIAEEELSLYSYHNDPDYTDEMDDEIAKAYEQFLDECHQ